MCGARLVRASGRRGNLSARASSSFLLFYRFLFVFARLFWNSLNLCQYVNTSSISASCDSTVSLASSRDMTDSTPCAPSLPIVRSSSAHSKSLVSTGLNLICAAALLGLAVGCSTMQTKSKENLLIAAGFRVTFTKTAAQQQVLKSLPPDKVTPIRYAGKRYYLFPDAAHHRVYVGRPTEYRRYRQLRLANQVSNENLKPPR
jgi:hypothetical protein